MILIDPKERIAKLVLLAERGMGWKAIQAMYMGRPLNAYCLKTQEGQILYCSYPCTAPNKWDPFESPTDALGLLVSMQEMGWRYLLSTDATGVRHLCTFFLPDNPTSRQGFGEAEFPCEAIALAAYTALEQ